MIDTLLAATLMLTAASDTIKTDPISISTKAAAVVPHRWRKYEQCVAERESGNSPTARNKRSSASGTYQFLDTSWRSGLAYMVAARLKHYGMPHVNARKIRIDLQRTHISRWPSIYQRVGFNEVIARGGAHHWRLPGSVCEQYR